MGLFATWVFDGGAWTADQDAGESDAGESDAGESDAGESDAGESDPGDFLRIDVHDSDFAAVTYRPATGSAGCFYLGHEPRHYFDDPDDHDPVDHDLEAHGLQLWAASTLNTNIHADDVKMLMADADGADPDEDFVETTVLRLLSVLGLPVPDELQPVD